MTHRRAIFATLLVAALSAATGVAIAAFVGTTTNAGNTFSAAASFGGMRVATGQYTGNAVDGRAIAVPFQPDLVLVKADFRQHAVIRTASMTADVSKFMGGATALTANLVQSLTATGFTVGTHAAVNRNGVSYDWLALKGYPGQMTTGSYTGAGTSQSIGGAGFSPDYVIVMAAAGRPTIQRAASMPTSFRFDTPAAAANGISSFDDDGFSVGASNQANASGAVYHYVAWNAIPGLISQGSYVGDGADNRPITGATFQPDFAVVKSGTAGSACDRAVYRNSSLPGDASHYFANVADAPNFVQALQADGFEVGTNCRVNTNAKTYYWVALHDSG